VKDYAKIKKGIGGRGSVPRTGKKRRVDRLQLKTGEVKMVTP